MVGFNTGNNDNNGPKQHVLHCLGPWWVFFWVFFFIFSVLIHFFLAIICSIAEICNKDGWMEGQRRAWRVGAWDTTGLKPPVCFILISFFSFLIYYVQVNYYGYNYERTMKTANGRWEEKRGLRSQRNPNDGILFGSSIPVTMSPLTHHVWVAIVAVALAGVFAILINKIYKIMEIFE